MTYEFRDALKDQHEMQVTSFKTDPAQLSDEDRAEFIRWNMLALEDELHEALAEVGWKPWATSKHLNYDAYKSELVDAFHFFMNLMLAAGIGADEFLASYRRKREVNITRQRDGYNGVDGKCPVCHRDLNDPGVTCTLDEHGNGQCTAGLFGEASK